MLSTLCVIFAGIIECCPDATDGSAMVLLPSRSRAHPAGDLRFVHVWTKVFGCARARARCNDARAILANQRGRLDTLLQPQKVCRRCKRDRACALRRAAAIYSRGCWPLISMEARPTSVLADRQPEQQPGRCCFGSDNMSIVQGSCLCEY